MNQHLHNETSDPSTRRVMQQLVRQCTLPTTWLRKASREEMVAAVRSSPLYAASVVASLSEALELVQGLLAQAENHTAAG